MKDETVEQLSERLNMENIYKLLDGHEARLDVANSEMGAVKTSLGVISTDIAWMKDGLEKFESRFDKFDNRLWAILTVLILGTLIQVALKVFGK